MFFFFHSFNLKVVRSRFLQPFSKKFRIRHSSSDSKFWSQIRWSDTKRPEMLIVLHICLFFMPYDSSNMGFGNTETPVFYNQSREMYFDLSLGKFGSWLNYSYYCFHSQYLRILWQLIKYSQSFLTSKGSQAIYIFWGVSLVFVTLPHWIFAQSPFGFLDLSTVEKLLPDLNLEKFWKFSFFPWSQAVPTGYWDRV